MIDDFSKESINSTTNHQAPASELLQPLWGVVYEDGTVRQPLTYEEARDALTQPPNGVHAMITTAEAAERFEESKLYICNWSKDH